MKSSQSARRRGAKENGKTSARWPVLAKCPLCESPRDFSATLQAQWISVSCHCCRSFEIEPELAKAFLTTPDFADQQSRQRRILKRHLGCHTAQAHARGERVQITADAWEEIARVHQGMRFLDKLEQLKQHYIQKAGPSWLSFRVDERRDGMLVGEPFPEEFRGLLQRLVQEGFIEPIEMDDGGDYRTRITLTARIEIEETQPKEQISEKADESNSLGTERHKTLEEGQGKSAGRKSGPKPTLGNEQERLFVATVQSIEGWKDKLEEVCRRLDEAEVPCVKPKDQQKYRGCCRTWMDYLTKGPGDEGLVKVIQRRLNRHTNTA